MASQHFCQEAHRICQATGTLLLFDEILTGFYRTGTAFCHTNIGFMPDIVLIGKIMGNGFPVSGVIIDKHHDVTPAMLPGSTYAGNPLTASAVIGTLRAMRAMPIEDMVADIERKITSTFSGLQDAGFALRGKGALWILECPEALKL